MNKIKECECGLISGNVIYTKSIKAKKGTCSTCKGIVDLSKMKYKGESKYKNKKVTVDGFVFDSGKEANRYKELKLLETGGYIDHLELQPKYDIVVNRIKIGFYKADFRYWDIMGDLQKVEDAKGYRTQIYKIKKKLVEAIYNIEIIET